MRSPPFDKLDGMIVGVGWMSKVRQAQSRHLERFVSIPGVEVVEFRRQGQRNMRWLVKLFFDPQGSEEEVNGIAIAANTVAEDMAAHDRENCGLPSMEELENDDLEEEDSEEIQGMKTMIELDGKVRTRLTELSTRSKAGDMEGARQVLDEIQEAFDRQETNSYPC